MFNTAGDPASVESGSVREDDSIPAPFHTLRRGMDCGAKALRFGDEMRFRSLFAALLLICVSHANAASPLPCSAPEAQGVSSEAVLKFIAAADKINNIHSVMVLRHGHVIAEAWWKPQK